MGLVEQGQAQPGRGRLPARLVLELQALGTALAANVVGGGCAEHAEPCGGNSADCSAIRMRECRAELGLTV